MEWFKTWFNSPYYHILYKNRDYNEAEAFLKLLLQDLQLPSEAHIIDLACGKGRHSVFLSRLGFKVLGLDLSEESILADKAYEHKDLDFQVHDMRDPIDSEPVDAVFNLFTSFGYFSDPKDDEKVFESVSKVLKPGGYFVLDFLNKGQVIESLVPKSEEKRDELVFHIEKRIEQGAVIKEIRFEHEKKPYFFFEKVQLHSLEYIESLAQKFGLVREKTYGDYALSTYHETKSPRCLSVFRKTTL
ncbi:class I SAM-dependent methyltransferase [Chryseobacterium sp. A301]